MSENYSDNMSFFISAVGSSFDSNMFSLYQPFVKFHVLLIIWRKTMGEYQDQLNNLGTQLAAVRGQLEIENLLKVVEMTNQRDILFDEEGLKTKLSKAKKLLDDWRSKNQEYL